VRYATIPKYDLGTIPLVHGGEPYYSDKTISIKDFRGNHLCNLCIAPSTKIALARKKSRKIGYPLLQDMDVLDVIELYHEASKIYKRRVPISPDISLNMKEFGHLLSLTTGIPIRYIMGSVNLVQHSLQRNMIIRILEAGSPTGDINIYDKYVGIRGGVDYAFAPRGKNLGVVLPSNHPTVPIIPMFVPAHKIPILFRPSRKDPFASLRMVNALCEAGIPEFSVSYFATGHDLVYDFVTKPDLGMIFGGEKTVGPYRQIPSVKVYGPCYSKILIDREFLDEHYGFCIDITYKSIMNASGRGGINCSDIIFVNRKSSPTQKTFSFMEFIDDLCLMLNEANILDPLHPRADVGAVPPNKAQSFINDIRRNITDKDLDYAAFIRNGRRKIPFKENDLIVNVDGITFLRPSLIILSSHKNPLYGMEMEFQFCKATEVPYADIVEACINTLNLTYLSDDHELLRKLFQESSIDKYYLGLSTISIDPAQPHEGFFTEHLYQFKATRNIERKWADFGEVAKSKEFHKWRLLKKTHKREEAIVR